MSDNHSTAAEVPYQSAARAALGARRPSCLWGRRPARHDRAARHQSAAQHRGVRPAAGRAPPGGGPRRRARLQRRPEPSQGRDLSRSSKPAMSTSPSKRGRGRGPNTTTRASPTSRASSIRCSAARPLLPLPHRPDGRPGQGHLHRQPRRRLQRGTTPLESKVDPGSTGMCMVQALGSALTYLQRYSLRAAIGLAAGVDDDGRGAGGTSPKISSRAGRRAANAHRRDRPQRDDAAQARRRRRASTP